MMNSAAVYLATEEWMSKIIAEERINVIIRFIGGAKPLLPQSSRILVS